MKRRVSFALIILLAATATAAPERSLTARLSAEQLDPAAFAEWGDGAEHAIQPTDSKDASHQPQWVIWTDKGTPGHSGLSFGASNTPGPRHLRVGLKSPTPIGAILVRGGVHVSVLKPDAAYPGNLADETQWIAAERIKDGKPSQDEATRESYMLWTLPSVTQTRAIRFTHFADVTAKEYAGWLGAAAIVPVRVANLSTMAMPAVSANQKYAGKIANGNTDPTWEQWANIPLKGGDRPAAVSPSDPEWVMLSWPTPVKLRGLATVFAGFAEADAQIYTGPADVHPREAPGSAWKTVATFTGLRSGYPVSLPADWLDFGQDITTRAIRLRITKPLANGGHPHTQDHPRGGKRVWLGELLALAPLPGNAELKAVIVRKSEVQERRELLAERQPVGGREDLPRRRPAQRHRKR